MRSGHAQDRRREALLECWRAIELFSPPTIPALPRRRPAARSGPRDEYLLDLTPEPGRVAPLLPWAPDHPETGSRRAPFGRMWRHEVYCGVFELELLRQAMIAVLPPGTDPDPGVPQSELVLSGQSAMIALVLDDEGRPIEDTSVVSACAWATGRLFDPGPSTPGWLDGFEELNDAFGRAIDALTGTAIVYGPTAPATAPAAGTAFERWPGSDGAAGAPGGPGSGGWQRLLAEILGGAAVGAVGALFGEVAGAALQGAAEPLVRRAADWVAARRPAEEQTDSGRADSGRPDGAGGIPEGPAGGIPEGPAGGVPEGEGASADGPDSSTERGSGSGPRALGLADLVALTAQIADLCGVQDHLRPQVIRVRSRLVHRPKDPRTKVAAAAPFLNSLLPPDLARVSAAVGKAVGKGIGPALEAYLTELDSVAVGARTDVRRERGVVLGGVAPDLVPAGRWPAPARFPLALSQQFAIDRMLADRAGTEGGMFSVNGPPGTGKTTMLRDLVAALVVERAAVLATFDRPGQAFPGQAWRGRDRQGRHARFVSRLDPRLNGFEIVVASSNNGAVENITAELPGIDALDDHWHNGPDHFSDLASALLGGPAWGLIAAVLGNKSNRKEFGDRFWWGRLPEKETRARSAAELPPLRGMQEILRDWIPPKPPAGGRRAVTPADQAAATAAGPAQPVPSWTAAVTAFRTAQAEVERLRVGRARLAGALAAVESGSGEQRITELEAAVSRADRHVSATTAVLDQAAATTAGARAATAAAETGHRNASAHVPRARQELATARADLSAARERAAHHREYVTALIARHDTPPTVERGLRGGLRRMLQSAADRRAAEQHQERTQAEITHLLVQQRAALEDSLEQVAAAVRTESLAAGRYTRSGTTVDEAAAGLTAALDHERAASAREASATSALRHARQVADSSRRDLRVAVAELDRRHRELREAARTLPSLPLDWQHLDEAEQELGSPWSDEAWSIARSELFLRALDLHRAFVAGAAKKVRGNLQVLMELMAGTNGPVPDEEVERAWQTLFLLVPVVSTTFSSIGSMFARLGRESIGWVLVDEAGQATPQAAAGALWRARRAVLVGDPLQLEPVVTMPTALQRRLLRAYGVDEHWLPSATSAQAVADRTNRYGTYLPAPGTDDEHVWVGSPLRVHRRCEEPMFTVSNEVAYGGLMVHGTARKAFPDAERDGLLPSRWLNTDDPTRPSDAPWGERDRRAFEFVLDHLHRHGVGVERVRVIAPFRALVSECKKVCRDREGWTSELLDERCATVHRAQGKEADVVVLVLGGGRPGAREWAARTPHLLNVAASRAKRRLYVIGERSLWAPLPHFDVLASEVTEFHHLRDRSTWPREGE
ncbi:AAA domain-containing protein [Streptomyces sp. NBC_00424]|uniref:AAA domain-containing protein n=1 Tax=Streptomyces sp. NBC_00424 TaxID=2903648 RepID=UPI002257EC54|nr:AAA domain-containing protein [Streptomyces sp. NBC_00424]MCX5077739.1 AAA domain-containing protein [Streptomyces sp. NBC_00424]